MEIRVGRADDGGRNGYPGEGRVQIAGVRDEAEARLLQECGVRWIGFPLRLEFPGNQDLGEEEARRLMRGLVPPARPVLITYLDRAREIADFCRFLAVRVVQLQAEVAEEELRKLGRAAPELTIVKALVVGSRPAAEFETSARGLEPFVDAFLADTFDPATGASGATGRTHDWNVSRRLVEASARPVVLAGGLTPANVGEAVRFVRPAAVDCHTGVEDEAGRKDRLRVERFVFEARAAFAEVDRARAGAVRPGADP
jgi:phosphoribosylanthranilate isomerase